VTSPSPAEWQFELVEAHLEEQAEARARTERDALAARAEALVEALEEAVRLSRIRHLQLDPPDAFAHPCLSVAHTHSAGILWIGCATSDEDPKIPRSQ
jgi:hypothetical protein